MTQEIGSRTRHLDDPCRLLRAKEVAALLSIHPITVFRWAASGRLPKPIRLGPATTVWRARDLREWLDRKQAAG